MTREEKLAVLRPLVERMSVSTCWVKGKNGPRHIDKPLDATMLSEHVMGGNAYGLCPIAPGESTCRVACLDLDSHKGATPWTEMLYAAARIVLLLEAEGYHPVQYRSSGGNGIHVYLIWDTPQDAYSVREMLKAALAAENFSSGTAGVAEQEIEVFPKQNSVPLDGFGNMFILPLSGLSERIDGEFIASPAVPVLDAPPAPERRAIALGGAPTADTERIRAALAAIPNEPPRELSYDDWRNIVFAIHHETDGDERGLALAHEFSARSTKYDPTFLDERVWPYVRSDRGGGVVTGRSLFARATAGGWVDPDTLADFDIVAPSGPADDFDVEGGGVPEHTNVSAPDSTALRYEFVPASVFKSGKPPGYIVDGVIPEAELVVIYGESGSGKTFFTLDLVQAIARGVEWRGRKVKQGRVAYVCAEGAGGFRNRIKAYDLHHGVDTTDLVVLADAPNFMSVPHVRELILAIKRAGPVSVVVVDTLAQVTPGANENAGEDMGKVIHHCKQIARKTGAVVVLIHHSGKDASKGARGWSGLRGAMDSEVEVLRAEENRTATVTKMKDGEEGITFGFKLQQVVVDEEGGNSAVVEYTQAVAKQKKGRAGQGHVQKVVRQAVIDAHEQDGRAPNVEDVLTEAVKHMPFDAGLGKDDRRRDLAFRALQTLAAMGEVVFEKGQVRNVGVEYPDSQNSAGDVGDLA